jgi:histidinol dehydrogenase
VSSEAPPNREKDDREREKGRIERLIPELVKRLVETGVERLAESPETVRQWANELRLPKELLNALLTHVEDAKSEIYKVVVREVREFLQRANLADEISRVLTGVTLEVKTQVRFVPNDAKSGRLQPTAKANVALTREVPEGVSEQIDTTKLGESEEKDR